MWEPRFYVGVPNLCGSIINDMDQLHCKIQLQDTFNNYVPRWTVIYVGDTYPINIFIRFIPQLFVGGHCV
jgi:hypothetical protein